MTRPVGDLTCHEGYQPPEYRKMETYTVRIEYRAGNYTLDHKCEVQAENRQKAINQAWAELVQKINCDVYFIHGTAKIK